MAFTEAASAQILNALTGRSNSASLLSTCYLGLSTTAPNAAGGNFTEPGSANGYARALVGNSSASGTQVMAAPSGGNTSNTDIIFFPEATSSWGTITHFGLWTAKTGGSLMVYGQLSTPVTVPENYVPLFRAGNFTMSLA